MQHLQVCQTRRPADPLIQAAAHLQGNQRRAGQRLPVPLVQRKEPVSQLDQMTSAAAQPVRQEPAPSSAVLTALHEGLEQAQKGVVELSANLEKMQIQVEDAQAASKQPPVQLQALAALDVQEVVLLNARANVELRRGGTFQIGKDAAGKPFLRLQKDGKEYATVAPVHQIELIDGVMRTKKSLPYTCVSPIRIRGAVGNDQAVCTHAAVAKLAFLDEKGSINKTVDITIPLMDPQKWGPPTPDGEQPPNLLLGLPFLKEAELTIDFEKGSVSYGYDTNDGLRRRAQLPLVEEGFRTVQQPFLTVMEPFADADMVAHAQMVGIGKAVPLTGAGQAGAAPPEIFLDAAELHPEKEHEAGGARVVQFLPPSRPLWSLGAPPGNHSGREGGRN